MFYICADLVYFTNPLSPTASSIYISWSRFVDTCVLYSQDLMFYIRARYVNLLVPFSSTAFCSTICHGFIVDMCVFYDQSLMFYIHSALSYCLYTFIIHSIVRNFSWSMPMARHPHMWRTLVHLTSLLDLLANIYNYHSSMCVAIILSDGLFNYQCPRVVFIVLLHSVIFHIVHVHT